MNRANEDEEKKMKRNKCMGILVNMFNEVKQARERFWQKCGRKSKGFLCFVASACFSILVIKGNVWILPGQEPTTTDHQSTGSPINGITNQRDHQSTETQPMDQINEMVAQQEHTGTASKQSATNPTNIDLWFVTYGDTPSYDAARNRIAVSAANTGWFEHIEQYTQHDLSAEFRDEFGEILSIKEGGGNYIWRFEVLKKVMAKMRENDILAFIDSGCVINRKGAARFHEYVELLKQSPHQLLGWQMMNHTRYEPKTGFFKEEHWTSDAIFEAFGVSERNDIRKSGQTAGGAILVQKGRLSEEWLSKIFEVLRKDPWIITHRYDNATKAERRFFTNCHDQSIQSVARKIKGFVSVPSNGLNQDQTPPEEPFWWVRSRKE